MYRDKDLNVIKANINNIQDEAMKVFTENYKEPTNEEYSKVKKVILDFMNNKKRILYGGYAQHLFALKHGDVVYNEYLDRPDMEYYSPEPLKDMIELCNLLKEKGFKYIHGKEGVHKGTYKVFVNFDDYCDIGYMNKFLYDNCPTLQLECCRVAHPHFMLIDVYRVYTDPMTSYFRLKKSFDRNNLFIQYYPFNHKTEYDVSIYNLSKEVEKIKDYVRKEIIHTADKNKLIIIGTYAYNHLVKKQNEGYELPFQFYQLISLDLLNDAKRIHKLLKDKFGNVEVTEYYPFYEYYDAHFEFSVNGNIVLKLYGNNKRCIVNYYSKNKNARYASSQVTILYLLIDMLYNAINKKMKEAQNSEYLVRKLFDIRDKYLEERNITVLDDSPFKEFIINCDGTPYDVLREDRLKQTEKKIKKFTYTPTGREQKVPEYKFPNCSGNKVIKKPRLR